MAYDYRGTLNKVMLIGRLGQDPELKYTTSGTALVTLSVATNTAYKGQDGNLVENTEWNRVVAWRKTAEVISNYAKKGTRVYVEGRLQTRSWEDQNGVKKYMTEIVADSIQLLETKGEAQSGGRSEGPSTPPEPDMPEPTTEEADDLPF